MRLWEQGGADAAKGAALLQCYLEPLIEAHRYADAFPLLERIQALDVDGAFDDDLRRELALLAVKLWFNLTAEVRQGQKSGRAPPTAVAYFGRKVDWKRKFGEVARNYERVVEEAIAAWKDEPGETLDSLEAALASIRSKLGPEAA